MAAVVMAETPVALSLESGRKWSISPSPKLALSDVTRNNLGTVRKLCSVLFPVVYSDRFYEDMLSADENNFCQLLYYNDIPVALLTSRLLERTADSAEAVLYIATLGVLAPYRRQGLATRLLDEILSRAQASWTPKTPDKPSAAPSTADDKKKKTGGSATSKVATAPSIPPKIKRIRVHVQTSNNGAKVFWEKRGFELKDTLDKYYTRVEPASAWVLERAVEAIAS